MTSIENIQPTTPAAAGAKPARDPKLWDAAKQFEQVLVEQLTTQMQATAQPQDDGSDDTGDDDTQSQSAVSGMYSQMLPGALAQGVSNGGGLGLAQQLYDAMKLKESK